MNYLKFTFVLILTVFVGINIATAQDIQYHFAAETGSLVEITELDRTSISKGDEFTFDVIYSDNVTSGVTSVGAYVHFDNKCIGVSGNRQYSCSRYSAHYQSFNTF